MVEIADWVTIVVIPTWAIIGFMVFAAARIAKNLIRIREIRKRIRDNESDDPSRRWPEEIKE